MLTKYGKESINKNERELMRVFDLQCEDAKLYFITCIKPRLDRAYKLYMSYAGDRRDQLRKLKKNWMSNIFVPYIHAAIETMMPRILDARPDFTVHGRNPEDDLKTEKLQQLLNYTWEISKMDDISEDIVRACMIYGNGYIQAYWKKDVRKLKFLQDKDILSKKYNWKEEEKTFYDAPAADAVDNYELWYDWHNKSALARQYWFRRRLMTNDEIKRVYNYSDKKRLEFALTQTPTNTENYAKIRDDIKKYGEKISGKNDESSGSSNTYILNDEDSKINEVFEWIRPYKDSFAIIVNNIPILKKAEMPIPYDFKETPYISIPFLRLPFESEGIGLPLILENLQIALNTNKNQRMDEVTLGIHKMWIVNPLANINKKQLVTRPFGIIYSNDPNGVREVQFSDVKASAYREETLLKSDMQYASGIDDYSMSVGGGGSASATEIRHLRESTLERIRLFINHLGSGYSILMRYWISMYSQFWTDKKIINIIGDNGQIKFPIIQKDDLMGEFDFIASVIPSIAGKNDIDKKQAMDMFQLLINLPFIDQTKLTGKVLRPFNWNLESLLKTQAPTPNVPGQLGQPGAPGAPGAPVAPPGGALSTNPLLTQNGSTSVPPGKISPSVIQSALSMLGVGATSNPSTFAQASAPINLLKSGSPPPTAQHLPNTAGFNRGGKVNTNIPTGKPSSPGDNIASQAQNIQS